MLWRAYFRGESHLATPVQMLEAQLITRPDQVMVIAGTGVSLATCGNHPCASWKGLLLNGLQRCLDVCGTDEGLIDTQRAILQNPKAPVHSWINVGQFITDELKRHRTGSFNAWLSESIGGITATETLKLTPKTGQEMGGD